MNTLSAILLVDDDSTTNFLNQLLLEDLQASQEVLLASNGWEALQLIQQLGVQDKCPQLILLDINMPEMDGFEFLEAYQALEFKQKQSVVIVVLTTSMNNKDIERMQHLPIKAYLNKPLTEEKVKDLMQQHFARA
jgi:CheY-like chemotaxis protein